jgi:hypothetical protein
MTSPFWEVWHGDVLICSRAMRLSRTQALAKVESERRLGNVMEARRARPLAPEQLARRKARGGRATSALRAVTRETRI